MLTQRDSAAQGVGLIIMPLDEAHLRLQLALLPFEHLFWMMKLIPWVPRVLCASVL